MHDYLGYQRKIESMGRRRRRDNSAAKRDENLLVVQTIRIADKFQVPSAPDHPSSQNTDASGEAEVMVLHSASSPNASGPPCLNLLGLLMAGALFLVAQAVLIGAWAFIWQKRRQTKMAETTMDPASADPRMFFPTHYPSGYMNH